MCALILVLSNQQNTALAEHLKHFVQIEKESMEQCIATEPMVELISNGN